MSENIQTSPAAAGEEGEGDEELAGLTPGAEERSQELIHPNEVLKALRAFVEENKQPPKDKKHAGQFQIMSQGDRDDTDDSAYWKSYPGALDENKMKLWMAMLQGSEQYSDMLKNRASLITETDGLRQQNAELRMLLHQYVNSKVNQELEVPPTRILQLELNPPSQ